MAASLSAPYDMWEPSFANRLPRESDAIGAALRNVFADTTSMPDDILSALRRIDGPTGTAQDRTNGSG